uniref:tetratricopeptide repeat protein n=1 Tax=Roseivirga sp. TaxID=1964215 RepID=UPI004048A36E
MQQYQARYQAANLSDKESKDSFVVRQKEFHRVMEDIRSSKPGDSMQHYVFVGRRGSGKSTLLRRIQAEVNLNEELKHHYLVVNLSEEQAGIYQLYDLWDYVLRDLEQQGIIREAVDWQDYEEDMKAYTHALFNSMQAKLKEAGKQLILLIDNIDRIFKAIRNGKGGDSSLLREQLMNHNLVRIIGGSTVMSEDYWRYDMPFYDFFNIKRLKPLSIEEIKGLLNHWAEQQNIDDIKNLLEHNPGKLQAIRMLTDGTPRTMLLFIDMLINRPHQNGYDYLRRIIDEATPIYQERLDQLPSQQQKVLTELSFFWEAVAVEKLIPVCKMQSKILSAQLSQLVKARLVEKVKGDTKNLAYRLEERFFNLWLLMTQGGPKQKREVKYLTIFLESWYDQNELRSVYIEFMTHLEKGTVKSDYAASMSKALAHSKHITVEERDGLIEKAKGLKLNAEWINELPESSSEIYEKVEKLFESEKYEEAEELLNNLEQNDDHKWFVFGLVSQYQEKWKLAEKYYLMAIEQNHSGATNNLAVLYEEQGKIELAEKYYLLAVEQNDSQTIFNLANFYRQNKNWELAEKYYLTAVDGNHTDAINNLANLYEEQGKPELAEKYYTMTLDQDGSRAMFKLANLYKDQGRTEIAERYYLMAVEQSNSDAMFNLALLYEEQVKLELTEKYYLMAVEKNHTAAMNNLASLYLKQAKPELAKKYYLMAVNQDDSGAINNLLLINYLENSHSLQAKELFLSLTKKTKGDIDIKQMLLTSIIALWLGEMEKFQSLKAELESLLTKSELYFNTDLFPQTLAQWLIHKQYHSVLKLLENHEDFKEQMLPLYYTTLHFVNGKTSELRNMPPELQESVDDILNFIKERQKFYYG